MTEESIVNGSMALARQPQVITIAAAEQPQEMKLRVAAYARVSSSSKDQLNSFEAQRRYYSELIASKQNWTLVDLYADEGITGTSAKKRKDFQRLMSDCRKGRIDRVLTKSISRFARNTKECLEAVRELKLLGIGVCFEEQNINTAEVSGEMLTTIFASIAQSESESISKNLRWGIQKRMQAGEFNTCNAPYGFKLENGTLEIQADEAKIVCQIFESYLSGIQPTQIAEQLNQEERSSRKWRKQSIEYILQNERYAGNALLQKRYTTDALPKVKKRNKGEQPMYYVTGSNAPIVSLEIFKRAQNLRQSRTRASMSTANPRRLSKKIFCGCCGTMLRPKPINGKLYMVCRMHEQDLEKCDIRQIVEEEFSKAFLRLYYNLKHHGVSILTDMLNRLVKIRERRMLWSEDVISLNKQISEISSQLQMLAEFKKNGLIDPDIYITQSNALTEQLRTAKRGKEQLLEADSDTTIQDTRELLEILENGPDQMDAFDAELFGELIDRVIVESNERIRFRLKNGLELPESIERTLR